MTVVAHSRHELSHKEHAPAPRPVNISRVTRVGNRLGIETRTLITHLSDDPLRVDVITNPHDLRAITVVCVFERVYDRLFDGEPDLELVPCWIPVADQRFYNLVQWTAYAVRGSNVSPMSRAASGEGVNHITLPERAANMMVPPKTMSLN